MSDIACKKCSEAWRRDYNINIYIQCHVYNQNNKYLLAKVPFLPIYIYTQVLSLTHSDLIIIGVQQWFLRTRCFPVASPSAEVHAAPTVVS